MTGENLQHISDLTMQAGFTCLESGFVRSKNSINVAVKNLIDFCISSALFTLVGFSLMFGESYFGIIGKIQFYDMNSKPMQEIAFFIFQLMFAGTAATIISGAVAERMKFSGYIIITTAMSVIIYPICGHWIWNNNPEGFGQGWLAHMGFIDFAGSTVVHSVAGWCALAAIIITGPRMGRFGSEARPLSGHNLPMAVLGVFLLWFGWFGFNGGSTLAMNAKVPMIIVNTTLAGATGGIAAIILSWYFFRIPRVEHLVNGVVAGLVAICAGCNLFGEFAGLIVGFVAGMLCILSMRLLEKLRIDDVIGAVPAHLVAGAWGTVAVALFAPIESFGVTTSRVDQLIIQATGIAAVGAYSFTILFVLIIAINKYFPFRVSKDSERIGLNISEHGASTSLLDLIGQMDLQARTGDFSQPVTIEPETESGHIATFYNTVLEKVHLESAKRQKAMDELYLLANYDALTNLVNRRYFYDIADKALVRAKRLRDPLAILFLDLDGFKQVNDFYGHEAGDELLVQVAQRCLTNVRQSDLVGRIGGDEFCILLENISQKNDCVGVAKKIIEAIAQKFELSPGNANIGVSVGIAIFDPKKDQDITCDNLITMADKAMYKIKSKGKGNYAIYSK
ncbi:MAG: ammonium transporter [Desulfuromonas sp.]|nr:ammonium transporter [Desulfuromonas sp.]